MKALATGLNTDHAFAVIPGLREKKPLPKAEMGMPSFFLPRMI